MDITTLSFIFMCLLYHGGCFPTPTYTTKYDNVNIDQILASERLLAGYVNCLLDLGPCTPDGKELKSNLPDAIANDCKNCTERQREGADKVMHYIIDNRPDDWNKLEQKYESDGSYKRQYLESKQITERKTEEKDMNSSQINSDKNKE
ncbi:unnamed protein product [Parnassius mnemosyne]|uniref:Uncharacterized protein n=1 Tax=Parnassius mnemosyne TaxID=213953 RepID=A0AAV1KP27_9NEOP